MTWKIRDIEEPPSRYPKSRRDAFRSEKTDAEMDTWVQRRREARRQERKELSPPVEYHPAWQASIAHGQPNDDGGGLGCVNWVIGVALAAIFLCFILSASGLIYLK